MASFNRKEFEPSYASFTLKVNENTDDNVYGATDPGYEIQEHVGTQRPDPQIGTYHYVLTSRRISCSSPPVSWKSSSASG